MSQSPVDVDSISSQNSLRNQQLFGTQSPVAFVTGSGAPRVGRSVAEAFFNEGFAVVLHANTSTDEAEKVAAELVERGGQAMVVTGAVEDEANAVRWLDTILERFGRVDVLVNSAAIWDPKSLEDTTADDFLHFFKVNTLGTALTCKHFGMQMVKQASGGSIINIGDWATRRPYQDFSAYFPSKGAITTVTQSMAVELATRNPNIRVNAILPGPVLLAADITEERRQKIVAECLLQREGTAEDVAAAAIFLATSPFITGVCLPVDGGRSIYAGPSADAVAHPNAK